MDDKSEAKAWNPARIVMLVLLGIVLIAGTLILALGMLVDNAIVIADGYLVKTAAGARPEAALSEIARETAWPLLGATLVAILAFGSATYDRSLA